MASTDSEKTLKKIAFDSVEQEAYLQLWRTYDRLREVETKTFEPHGITAQQYNVLRILQSVKAEYLPTATLASRLVSRSPDMTRMLDKLEAKGLISRRRGVENRRGRPHSAWSQIDSSNRCGRTAMQSKTTGPPWHSKTTAANGPLNRSPPNTRR